jgi:hypothetical protein
MQGQVCEPHRPIGAGQVFLGKKQPPRLSSQGETDMRQRTDLAGGYQLLMSIGAKVLPSAGNKGSHDGTRQ